MLSTLKSISTFSHLLLTIPFSNKTIQNVLHDFFHYLSSPWFQQTGFFVGFFIKCSI